MTESELRQKVANIMKGWLGRKESSGGHKAIIDIYNGHKPLTRNYKVKYTDEWCATTVSAAFIKAGLADIAELECSCGKMVELYKAKGRWVENDSYRPSIGDIIMYDWGDNGKGDCTGWPDHVGIVAEVSGNTIKVIEGNKGEAVAYRSLSIGGRYIRGYCLPDYKSKATKQPETAKTAAGTTKGTATVKVPILSKGSKGEGVKPLQQLLKAQGYDPNGIDGSFGPGTDSAVRKYQKAKGLAVDGSVGPATWGALLK